MQTTLSKNVPAVAKLRSRAVEIVRAAMAPPPKLTISEWADRHRVLSRPAAEPGPWRTSRAPYLRGLMDAFSNLHTSEIVFMKASQVGATECLVNLLGYYIDQDPAAILCILPTDRMGEAFSKDRLAPALRDSPALRDKVGDPKSRDSSSTLLHKTIEGGGHITISGANAPASLASRPIRILLCDEVDRFPPSAGAEGDPVSLARKRTATYWNRKIALTSTPTTAGISRIEKAFAESDQRSYFVPCPHCEHMQPLRFGGQDAAFGLKWERDGEGAHLPDTVAYLCEGCGALIEESEKPRMLERGEWRAKYPERQVAGFHLNQLYSPWTRWSEIVTEFLEVRKDPFRLRVWTNTVLAEVWNDAGESLEPATLSARREAYSAEVPAGVGILTAGVDVQDDRLELLVQGWGAAFESWIIEHHRIYGDPVREEVWQRLETLLTKVYEHESGAKLRLHAVCIDSGHLTESVYSFVRSRRSRNVYAAKGIAAHGRPLVGKPSKANKAKVQLLPIGVNQAKDLLFARLRVGEPGPGYVHFGEQQQDGLDAEFFAQLGAEVAVLKFKKGARIREYVQKRRRNEAIDLLVYAMAALHVLGPAVTEHLDELVDKVQTASQPRAEATEPSKSRPRNRWIHGWR